MPSRPIDIDNDGGIRSKELSPGARWLLLDESENSQVAVVRIEPGSDSGKMNTHPGDQLVHVISGTAVILIGDEEASVPHGHVTVIPAGVAHHVFNRGGERLEFISIYAPSF